MSNNRQNRTYTRRDCAVFRKTDEAFGGLSNMAPGFPVRVNGVRVMTIEALYQASRFPHLPDVQRLIIEQHSPMTAKMVSKPHRKDSRADWDKVRITVMRWCLRLKLSQHWSKFSQLLLSTGDRAIVEDSKKDDFWGAVPSDGETLVGLNVLGRLLMELREEIKKGAELRRVEAPAIENFLLFGEPLQVVDFRADKNAPAVETKYAADNALDDFALPLFSTHPSSEKQPKPRSVPETIKKDRDGLIEGVRPYPEYKESGSRWLGRVPETWRVRTLRTLLTKRNERNRADLPLLSVARERGVFVRSLEDADENHNVIPEDLSNYKVARAGCLVINKMKAWQGSMGIAPCDGIVSPAYFVFDFAIENRAFGQRLLRSKPYVAHFAAASDGVRVGQWDLSIAGMREIPVLIPPLNEQTAIVRFLENASRKIDGFIRAKRKLIGLLNEQKQAIVHRAVTRGLDPHAPLKPSGNAWLGDIPKNWDQHALWTLSKLRVERNPGNLPLLSVFLDRGVIRYEEGGGQVHAPSLDLSGYQVVHPGDFVLNNQQAWRGSVGVSAHHGIISPAYIVLKLCNKLDSRFANFLMRSRVMVDQFVAASKGVGDIQRQVFWPFLRYVQVPVPKLEEQKALVELLAAETRGMDRAIARTEREIALMQEYRTRLTADVVTGKLDVRAAAAHLPALNPDSIPEAATEAADETEPEEVEA